MRLPTWLLARGDGIIGRGIWVHRTGPQYVCRRILPSQGREGRARVERFARVWARRWRRSSCCCSSAWECGGACRYPWRRRVLLLLIFSMSLPLDTAQQPDGVRGRQGEPKLPARFWLFAAFALLYGICETMNGNWASVYMTAELGASAALASLALTVFWATVTAGRVLFAALDKWLPADAPFASCRSSLQPPLWPRRACKAAHPLLGIAGICRGRSRLFGAAASGDQFRPGRIDGRCRFGGRRADLRLSGWLRHRRLWRGAAARPGGLAPWRPSTADTRRLRW